MANEINCFGLIKSKKMEEGGGIYYHLTHKEFDIGIKDFFETIFAQYELNDGRFFIVLQNAPWEETNYKFYILSKDFMILDCVHLYSPPDRDDGLIERYSLEGNIFTFQKYDNNHRYAVKINDKGERHYSISDLKHRSLASFLKLRKLLILSKL